MFHPQILNSPEIICCRPLSLPKISFMEARQSTGKYWFLCFLWLGIMIALLIVYRQFFWLALPGVCTYFAKAMDIM